MTECFAIVFFLLTEYFSVSYKLLLTVAWPSGKAEACKASIPQFESGCHLFFMLILIATPIGNLADITYRAVQTLASCDYILCEDTRYSLRLLKHYNIHKPCHSFHKFNENQKESLLINDLKAGKTIGVISDAGTPGISDPGEQLVKRCIAENIIVTTTPGPCAAIAALTCSGLSTQQFQFCGFLPRTDNALKNSLLEILQYPGTTICYESPKRIHNVLRKLLTLAPTRLLSIARELTKLHEEVLHGTAAELLERLQEAPKGEIVLLIAGNDSSSKSVWENLSPEEHVQELESTYHLSRRDAIKMAANLRGESKRNIYNLCSK